MAQGATQREAVAINTSLHALSQVIKALVASKKGHVPYRPTHKFWSGNVGPISVDGDVEYMKVHLEVVYHAITAMPEYSGKSFEELRIEECYQQGRDWGNRLRRDCATCRRSLAIDKYSNTQLKKGVGVSRCKACVQLWSDADMEKICESLRLTLAKLNT